jgi:hypothetical protein
MTTPTETYQLDRLVHDYLLAVALAGADLPEGRLDELIDDLSEHIAVARTQHAPTEAAVLTILHRLGPPGAIAEAARLSEPQMPQMPPVPQMPRMSPTPAWNVTAQRSPVAVVLITLLAVLAIVLVLCGGIAVILVTR